MANNANERAQALIGRLNGGQGVAGSPSAEPTQKLIRGIIKGGKTGQPRTDQFLDALVNHTRPQQRKPAVRQPGHLRETTKQDEVSLVDGLSEEGRFTGSQQKIV